METVWFTGYWEPLSLAEPAVTAHPSWDLAQRATIKAMVREADLWANSGVRSAAERDAFERIAEDLTAEAEDLNLLTARSARVQGGQGWQSFAGNRLWWIHAGTLEWIHAGTFERMPRNRGCGA